MTRYKPATLVYQHGVGKAELTNARCDLANLQVRVHPGIIRVRRQVGGKAGDYFQVNPMLVRAHPRLSFRGCAKEGKQTVYRIFARRDFPAPPYDGDRLPAQSTRDNQQMLAVLAARWSCLDYLKSAVVHV